MPAQLVSRHKAPVTTLALAALAAGSANAQTRVPAPAFSAGVAAGAFF